MTRNGKKALFAIPVALTMVLAGCGTSAANAPTHSAVANEGNASSQIVTLHYMLWDPNEEIGYKKSIAVFEKLHPNIKVVIEQYPWSQYWQKLETEMAAGTAPDVFWDHVTYFPTFVTNGQLLNLTPYIKSSHIDLGQYYPNLLKQYEYNGNIYGLPKDWDTIAIFYNKKLFEKEHVPFPTNLTWNPENGGTLLKVAEEMTVDKNGKHPGQPGFNPNEIVQYGFMSYNSNQSFYYNFLAEDGVKILDHNFGTKVLMDTPQGVMTMQNLLDMIYKYHVSPPAAEGANVVNSEGNAQQLFEEGKLAMYTDGDWVLTPVVKACNFPVGIAPLPVGPDGRVSVMNGLSDAIYAHTKYPQQAWELVQWLASPQSERILASGGYVWPGIKSLAPLFAQAWAKKGVNVTPFLEESKGKTISFPITVNWGQAENAIDKEFDLMWLGKVSPSQALQASVQQADAALNGGQ
ncbi:sugar ABC transporter substrate-binding protein [Alicyclobacillus mali]|uniref:Sugar ABC transporter substrate-binding protein n=1 Tax=Alicyclobacillus mali (ex Roth et al. 2021) TaxID=1123961 RepID=A0ABS0EYD0_9BACL|nr:sugar ABC transporter substrate-binding protein [Alicyclobacillus mali (ex Roth et al. 2021)]MBF8376308.1 sugar ABC transporter substrate-binding protein [Alicyclobacillus mali (ex Roth et al. 2021)]